MSASNLVIVAHPDDETIFFGGTMLTFKKRGWKVIVVTNGNADGQGARRQHQLEEACRELGVKEVEQWDFPDIYERRLDATALIERIASMKKKPHTVYTHGIIGEYGHPHHQDVSWAVHKHFRGKVPVWSVAYNSFATKSVDLSRKVYEKKVKVFSQTYHSETVRFARVLPVNNSEGFLQADWSEVDYLYSFFTGKTPDLDLTQLRAYRWFAPYLLEQKKVAERRRF